MYASQKNLRRQLEEYEVERLHLLDEVNDRDKNFYLKENFMRIYFLEGCIHQINLILNNE